jgi:hypothetical protein
MRFYSLLCFLFALVGVSAAQDSNFSVGPQYLMNYGSPQFLRPIATPSLSLSAPLAPISSTETGTVAAPEISSVSVGVSTGSATGPATGSQNQADFARIYWGGPEVTEPESSVVEVSGTATASNLPASIVNVGVQETVDAKSLGERGYGVTVSEMSTFWKTHKRPATRHFTNRDIERLHGS